jgi:hypothetical protein
LSEQEVLDKPYKFLFEKQYYANKEHVPKDNPHWQIVGLKNISIKDIEIKTEPIQQEST